MRISLYVAYHGNTIHEFRRDFNNTVFAALLVTALQNALGKRMEEIRREHYNLGWKHAKSKSVRKTTWFGHWLP